MAFPETRAPGFAVVVDLPGERSVPATASPGHRSPSSPTRGAARSTSGHCHGKLTTSTEPAAPDGHGRSGVGQLSLNTSTGPPGRAGVSSMALIRLSISEVYQRIFVARAVGDRQFGQLLFRILILYRRPLPHHRSGRARDGPCAREVDHGSVHELFVGTERVRQGDFTHKIAVADDRPARRAGRSRSTR